MAFTNTLFIKLPLKLGHIYTHNPIFNNQWECQFNRKNDLWNMAYKTLQWEYCITKKGINILHICQSDIHLPGTFYPAIRQGTQ